MIREFGNLHSVTWKRRSLKREFRVCRVWKLSRKCHFVVQFCMSNWSETYIFPWDLLWTGWYHLKYMFLHWVQCFSLCQKLLKIANVWIFGCFCRVIRRILIPIVAIVGYYSRPGKNLDVSFTYKKFYAKGNGSYHPIYYLITFALIPTATKYVWNICTIDLDLIYSDMNIWYIWPLTFISNELFLDPQENAIWYAKTYKHTHARKNIAFLIMAIFPI